MSRPILPTFLCLSLVTSALAAEPQANPAPARTTQAQTAAGQAAQATALRGFQGGAPERENVDPQDPVERFALLTPGGPLVIEATLTIDGQPFRTVREKLIDELLVAADKDKDGKPTWEEALTASRFTLGRLPNLNEQQKKNYVQAFDKNSDNVVDRSEVRQFLAQFFQGATFSLGAGLGYGYGQGGVVVVNGRAMMAGGQADVRALLDTDSDGVLSDKEIAVATDRLKSRDADDNDLLTAEEISGQPTAYTGRVNSIGGGAPPPQSALLLGPTAKAELLHAVLVQKYKNAEGNIAAVSFSAVPKLFTALDKNEDGLLQAEETLALNTVPPHVVLSADIGSTGNAKGLSLKSTVAEVSKTGEAAESIALALPGVKVSLAANLAKGPQYNFEQTATTMITRFDKDSNQYLEKSELPDGIVQQFDGWDADGDGKVYAAEITASYARTLAPQASQVTANVASQGNSLFQTLDQTGDSRLSLREMRAAGERIKTLDADKDGRISQSEIPATLTVTFGLGTSGFSSYGVATKLGGATPVAPGPAAGVPEWFARMDRNGDGDVTLKEFLGDEADFKKLDANSDGFIEVKEAKEAK